MIEALGGTEADGAVKAGQGQSRLVKAAKEPARGGKVTGWIKADQSESKLIKAN